MKEEITEETPVDGDTQNAETEESATTEVETEVETEVDTEVDTKIQELEAHNKQLFERAKKAEADAKAARAEKVKSASPLDVEDYIGISAALEGLDAREKEKLAREHKLTGKPLKEIREEEDYKLWQGAYRSKVEKEQLALKPNGTQSDSDAPQSFSERLKTASLADKEKLLAEAGLYKSPRPKSDRVNLGRGK